MMMDFNREDAEKNKFLAAISYIPLLFIVTFAVAPNSEFAKAHAKQGLILFIVEVINGVLSLIPAIGFIFKYLGGAILFIVAVVGFVYAITGNYWKIPFIGDISEEIKI